MSFVAEILSSAEKVEIENLNKSIPDIVSTIDSYKQDVLQYIDKMYIKFSERPKTNLVLLNKANNLTNNIIDLEKTIDNVTNNDIVTVKNKVTAYKQELEESKCALEIASTLVNVHESSINIKDCLQHKRYIEAIKEYQQVKCCMGNDKNTEIVAFNALMDKVNKTWDNLLSELAKEFGDYIKYNDNVPFTLTINKHESLREIVQALGLAYTEIALLDGLTTFLWKNVFCSIVNYKVSIDIIQNDDMCKISLNVINQNEKDNYKDIFKNILMVIEFLNMHFNYPLENYTSTMVYIGNLIKEDLSELLIKECLADTIPSNTDELLQYKNVIQDTEHLHKELVKYGIFSDEASSVLNYANNVDVLFINKKCQEYITSATEIMKKDLHDMIEIGTASSDENSLTGLSDVFPHCYISRSTLDLISLAEKIMDNATNSQISAEKLYSTVQNIFDIYGKVVQNHHQKLLQTIPQQVALFHNNCMYLSHKLSTWIETYQQLPTVQCKTASILEQAHLLKQIGNKAFVDSLEQQIKQIDDIMKESGITSVGTLEKLEPVTEKSIRQCLRQQELLRTVWHKVLSSSDYNRSIGCLLNYLCNFIINELLKVEDISSEAGDQLVDIFKVVLTRGPKLFLDPKDIHLYVKSWYRFNELVLILGSSLIEICDRWADGKGPLALQFKPEEVQTLIRALFQNTDRRAAVLARIIKL